MVALVRSTGTLVPPSWSMDGTARLRIVTPSHSATSFQRGRTGSRHPRSVVTTRSCCSAVRGVPLRCSRRFATAARTRYSWNSMVASEARGSSGSSAHRPIRASGTVGLACQNTAWQMRSMWSSGTCWVRRMRWSSWSVSSWRICVDMSGSCPCSTRPRVRGRTTTSVPATELTI